MTEETDGGPLEHSVERLCEDFDCAVLDVLWRDGGNDDPIYKAVHAFSVAMREEIERLGAENAKLRVLLAEAAEDLVLQGSYADGYSAPRMSLATCVAKYRSAAVTPNDRIQPRR
jgi:hypothetical protein